MAAAGTSNVTVVVTATGGTATAEGGTSSSTSSATGKRGAEPAHFLVTCSVSVQFATYVKCEIQNPFKFLSHCQNLFCKLNFVFGCPFKFEKIAQFWRISDLLTELQGGLESLLEQVPRLLGLVWRPPVSPPPTTPPSSYRPHRRFTHRI